MKEKLFFDIEENRIVSETELKTVYYSDPNLQSEYETFSEYEKCCMITENGTLKRIYETV